MLAAAGGRGFFNAQVLRPRDGGAPMVSDVNPRFGTSFGHSLAEGIDLAGFYLGLGPAKSKTPRRPARTVRVMHDVVIHALPERPGAVVFDLDDTLVDHKRWFARKALQAYQDVATTWAEPDRFRLEALGLIDEGERRHFIDLLCERLGWDAARHASFLAAYRQARASTPVHADVAACLASLRAAGLKLAILTDNPPATQQQKLDSATGLDGFDAIVFARETGAEKPDPRAFLAVARALGLPPADLCMIGDNLFRDCLGALNAGYGSSILLQRHGAFIQPHPDLAALAMPADDPRLARAANLVTAREILLGG
jgi:HAD superfamily hydrolase (TIGR01549 family)